MLYTSHDMSLENKVIELTQINDIWEVPNLPLVKEASLYEFQKMYLQQLHLMNIYVGSVGVEYY